MERTKRSFLHFEGLTNWKNLLSGWYTCELCANPYAKQVGTKYPLLS